MSIKDTDESQVMGTEETAETSKNNHKKLKYGTMFYVTIVLVVAIVVVLNIMLGLIAKRRPMKFDITPDNRYELTEQSINAMKSLKKDVDIVFTCDRDYFVKKGNEIEEGYASQGIAIEIPFEIIPELIDKYSLYAAQGEGSVNVKYVNMDGDPDIINRYKDNYDGDIGYNSMIVASGEKVEVFSANELLNMIYPDQSTMTFNFVGESTITSAILNVTDAHPVKVAFIKTMNGASVYNSETYSQVISSFENLLLAKNGYECTDIDISTDELDPNLYDMAVIYAPSVDFTEPLINKLDEFLKNGGNYDRNLIYVPDLSSTSLNNIEDFLADWSLKIESNIIIDEKNAETYASNIYVNVNDPDSVGKLPNEKLPVIAPFSREITVLKKNNEDVVKEVLKSCDESYTVDMKDMQTVTGKEGARAVVVRSQKQRNEQFKSMSSSVLVIGSSAITNGTYLTQSSAYNNGNVILNIINTMTGKENGIIIPDKALQQSYISASKTEAKVIKVIVVWVLPFIVAAIGVIVLLRRRNK
ncbi:MAG: GldG family protein [Ruminococcus sp.]|uniref:Gldg family protein n=1 Tax=Ruminococcus sp. TaxID=41978 RepID=UPI0025E61004|nr:Gldg family protein [Ruminococcus sp.]MCR4796723.1 GldG family protein [Ruminococcus sp.]